MRKNFQNGNENFRIFSRNVSFAGNPSLDTGGLFLSSVLVNVKDTTGILARQTFFTKGLTMTLN